MDILSLLALASGAITWLGYDAHHRRVAGEDFAPWYRALLWSAAASCALVGLAAMVLTVAILNESPGNRGFGGLLLWFCPVVALVAALMAFAFTWYARDRPAA
jgi:hypothetical protein